MSNDQKSKGMSGVEGGKGTCYQWKEKKGQCSQGYRCSFRHETKDRAQTQERTAATSSEPTVSRGRSVSRKRSIRGKSNQPCHALTTVQILLQRCLHANAFVNIGIRPSASSMKVKRVVRLETSVCFRITRLMNNQIKGKKELFPKKRRQSDEKNAAAMVKSVAEEWVLQAASTKEPEEREFVVDSGA